MLVRHTRPEVAAGVCYGRLDLPVADSFAEDASSVITSLSTVESLVTSPLQRCQKLANAIAEQFDLAVTVDSRIAEMDFGSWEGVPWSDIPRTQLDEWAEDFMHARPHGGENVAMLLARTNDALNAYQATGDSHIVVTHAGVIRAALSTGDNIDDWQATIDFGQIVKLNSDDPKKEIE